VRDGSSVIEVVKNLLVIGHVVLNVDEILERVAVLIAATIQEKEHGQAVFVLGFLEAV
tara:strand:- start:120 stop:293 length:174 start_codon:yes stop_codon:yes gene_type:complete